MAEITAGMVRELRDKTDAPMMECKKALTEAEQHFNMENPQPGAGKKEDDKKGPAKDKSEKPSK